MRRWLGWKRNAERLPYFEDGTRVGEKAGADSGEFRVSAWKEKRKKCLRFRKWKNRGGIAGGGLVK
jgi:hypothetical protein